MPEPPPNSDSLVIKDPLAVSVAPPTIAGTSAVSEDPQQYTDIQLDNTVPYRSRTERSKWLSDIKRRKCRRRQAETQDDTDDKQQKKWYRFIYDKESKTVCGRNCRSWLCIIAYTTMYIIFLMTFTMILLYISLLIIKALASNVVFKVYMYSYQDHGIGLSATPSSENTHPLIWYQNGDSKQYQKYISALDKLLEDRRHRRKREDPFSELGPCGTPPYGYGATPCVILRINKQKGWFGEPLRPDSPKTKEAPTEVQSWIKKDQKKLWLHCSGFYPWDKEHLGKIKYYPDPPGLDASLFPMNMTSKSPLVAVQFSNFTIGMSICVECKLWYAAGPSAINFILYVGPDKSILKLKSV